MDERDAGRELERLKWVGLLLPVAFVWAFELVRFGLLERAYPGDTGHVLAALVMAAAVIVFGIVMSSAFGRAQRQIVGQNKDFTITHAVRAATRESRPLAETLELTLGRVVAQSGGLAGALRLEVPGGEPIVVRWPDPLPDGLAWVSSLLDEPGDGPTAPEYSERRALDSGVLEVPLLRGGQRLGVLRVVSHPPRAPVVSQAALADVGGELATAAQLSLAVADLERRERERAALYDVALQLTRSADVSETLDTITGHARGLLTADRAVVCLSEPGATGEGRGQVGDRVALVDNGTACLLAHVGGPGAHALNPLCPLRPGKDAGEVLVRPLRGPEGILGELCVARERGPAFTAAERTFFGALADMAAIAVRTARLREAEQQWTILSERDRIARELHDSLAQVLGVIHLRLRALEPRVAAGHDPGAVGELSDLAEVADEAYRDVREAILGLRETISSEHGFEGAMRDYLRKYSRQTGIAASLACEGNVRGALHPSSEVQLLRVVQEALTNVRKHAGARNAVVRLDCRGRTPVLSVEDDGRGFDQARVTESLDGGFGLTSMRERVAQIGGTLDIHTGAGQGTRIVVRLEEVRGSPAAALAHPAGR